MLFKREIVILCSVFLVASCSRPSDDLVAQYKKHTNQLAQQLEKNPADRSLRLKLARFYYQFHDYEKVKELLAAQQEMESKIILAKTLAQTKEYTKALELFEQIGEIENDSEYTYLHAFTLEEKNLYAEAVKLYTKVKPPFAEAAAQRSKAIGISKEEGIPQNITGCLSQHKDFLSALTDDAAVILFADEMMEVSANNTSVSSVHVAQKILKEKGKELAEVQISYDSTYERVELEYARTITADGSVVYAGKESIRDVSKYLNFPLYSNAKVFIISMPAVDIGSIIEYKLKIYSSKLVNTDDFSFSYHVREGYPVAQAAFSLIFPQSRDVKLQSFNEQYGKDVNLQPVRKEANNTKIYSWQFQHISPIIPEDKMPPAAEINPAMSISSFSSWQEVYAWWQQLYKDKILVTEEMKGFLTELIKDCKTDLEKAKKIYEFCARDVRYVAVEYGESGYEPHHAQDIFVNRYGDCKDKAILLVALLREAGLKAFPVLIPTKGMFSISEDFPTIQFNHAIAAVQLGKELTFMDATAQTTSFGDIPLDDQERLVVVFFDDHYELITTPLLSANEITYDMDITIDDNEDARIQRRVSAQGYFAAYQRYYLKYTHPQHIKDNIQQRMMQISPFAQIEDYRIENVDDLDKSPILQYICSTKKLLNPARHLRMIPYLGDIEMDTGYAGKEGRVYPVEFPGLFREFSQVNIHLPKSLKVMYLPVAQAFQTPWFDFNATYTQGKNSIEFSREIKIKKRRVELAEYSQFKAALEKVAYLLREEVILERR